MLHEAEEFERCVAQITEYYRVQFATVVCSVRSRHWMGRSVQVTDPFSGIPVSTQLCPYHVLHLHLLQIAFNFCI